MQTTLKTVQTIAKVIKVLVTVFMYICFVAGGICLFSAVIVLITPQTFLGPYIENYPGFYGINDRITAFILCIVAAISAVAAGVVYMFAQKYFKNELIAGTPFTFAGAKELKRLAIISISVSVGAALLSAILTGIAVLLNPQADLSSVSEVSVDVTVGIIMLILSAIFKHGAALREELVRMKKEELAYKNQHSETEIRNDDFAQKSPDKAQNSSDEAQNPNSDVFAQQG